MRNREHARNTRIRKKEYVESLKVQVEEMLQAKAREERETLLESDKVSAEVRGGERSGQEKGGVCVSVCVLVCLRSALSARHGLFSSTREVKSPRVNSLKLCCTAVDVSKVS